MNVLELWTITQPFEGAKKALIWSTEEQFKEALKHSLQFE